MTRTERAQLSRINTLYIYERLWVALDCETADEVCREISDLMAELAVNYHADTGERIGKDLGQYIMEGATQ
jgi:hypothetical protein